MSDSEDEGNVIQKQKPPKSSELQPSAETTDQSAPNTEDSSKATNKEETASFSSEKDVSSHKDKKPLLKRTKLKYLDEDFIWKTMSGHPFILPLHSTAFESEKIRHYFISKYLPMIPLRKFVKIHKVLQTKVARVLTAQITSAIHFIHSKEVFLRDLNSENILICSDGKAKISSFKHSVCAETSQGLHGHFFYQAPEVLSGEIYNKTADWFSLGVCLYEMVMTHTPVENHCWRHNIKFRGLDYYGKIVVLLNCTYYIPKVFPEDLKQALGDLLNKDPTKRLGYKDDLDAIKIHPFFNSIDWESLDQGLVTAVLPNREEVLTRSKFKLSPLQTKHKF